MKRRHPKVGEILGSLGMTVFIGCLVIFGEARDAPPWLVWPRGCGDAGLMPLGSYLDWH